MAYMEGRSGVLPAVIVGVCLVIGLSVAGYFVGRGGLRFRSDARVRAAVDLAARACPRPYPDRGASRLVRTPPRRSRVKYWEDFKVGESTELGSHSISEAEILAFARKYDPQPFHTDPEAARRSIFGGLIPSRWHTCALISR